MYNPDLRSLLLRRDTYTFNYHSHIKALHVILPLVPVSTEGSYYSTIAESKFQIVTVMYKVNLYLISIIHNGYEPL